MRRQSRIGSLGQLLREPPGSICSRAKPSFAPASLALNLHARGRLPCIHTRLRKRIESAVSPALRVRPASRCSCFDLCMGEGSSSCLAAPWLLRARHAQPSPSFRSFSFRFATPYLHLRLREDRGLPVLGPCLPLPSPRRLPTSITRDPLAHQLGRGLSSPSRNTVMRCTPSPCTSLPCIAPPPSSVAGSALTPVLPRRFRTRPNRVRSWPASRFAAAARTRPSPGTPRAGLAVLVLAHATPPRQSSTCTFNPPRRAAPCPHTRLRAFCSSAYANVTSASLWRHLDPERLCCSSAYSPACTTSTASRLLLRSLSCRAASTAAPCACATGAKAPRSTTASCA
jgi:hypothetical protein